MTAFGVEFPRLTLARMREDRGVMIAVVAGGTAVALGVIGLLGFAIETGHGSDTLLTVGLAAIAAYLHDVRTKIATILASRDGPEEPPHPREDTPHVRSRPARNRDR